MMQASKNSRTPVIRLIVATKKLSDNTSQHIEAIIHISPIIISTEL